MATAPPRVFAPGIVSGPANEDSPAFTPDGRSVYFDRLHWPNGAIMVSHLVDGVWSEPKIAPFSGQWLDHDPAMAPDGSHLIFTSNRAAEAGGPALAAVFANGKSSPGNGGHLWRVDRVGDGWGEPKRLPGRVNLSTRSFAPSVAADGSVYFQRPGDDDEFHLYRSQYRDGEYLVPTPVRLGPADAHELDPAIAPDESFLVFDANYADRKGPDRLFIVFREGEGWSAPLDLGDAINRHSPWAPHLGPDGVTLYFAGKGSLPVSYPRSQDAGERDMARLQAWDNGNENLWMVSLQPWLDARRGRRR
ncbi:TolB family protein [Lysobacter sp. CA196]